MSDQENRQSAEHKQGRDVGRRRRPGDQASTPETSINMDELRDLIALIRENGLAEFELERKGFRVRLRRDVATGGADLQKETPSQEAVAQRRDARNPETPLTYSPVPTPAHPGAQAENAASEDQDLHIITSPIVGTFYRSASPSAEPFIKIGSSVEADSVVCIIEAMKLMNEIQAETTGVVAKIYVENGQPVEYGQPLFGIRK